MDKAEVVVIGAGVVGLAVARALALAGREVIVVEQHDAFGTETSSRNSEVIHAGIYYRPGGMRSRLCVEGKELLYDFCASHHVPYKNTQKLIVAANSEDVDKLDALNDTARANRVFDLEKISSHEARVLEPMLECSAALLSPSSGIVDTHALMFALLGDLEDNGGALVCSAPLISGTVRENFIELSVGGAEPISIEAELVINCGGLHSDKVAFSIAGLDQQFIPEIRPAKGQYFTYSGKAPFSRLIYPLHTKDSQGVHYTCDLGGQARLGPDIRWDAALGDYSVDPSRKGAFVEGVQKFWPDLDPDRLQPGYAGQRPKTAGPGREGDFIIQGQKIHGTTGYIGLYGIESPGLTSCLAIGRYVSEMVCSG